MATKLLLVEEVAARLRLDPRQVRELISKGELPAIVLSPELIRIADAHLRRFLRTRTVPFAQPGWQLPRNGA